MYSSVQVYDLMLETCFQIGYSNLQGNIHDY